MTGHQEQMKKKSHMLQEPKHTSSSFVYGNEPSSAHCLQEETHFHFIKSLSRELRLYELLLIQYH